MCNYAYERMYICSMYRSGPGDAGDIKGRGWTVHC